MLIYMTSEFNFCFVSTSLTHESTALVSCEVIGTTFAFCRAKETISVQGTLAQKDLNWMDIPLTETSAPTSSTQTAEPVKTPLPHSSNPSWYSYQSYPSSQNLLMCLLIFFCVLTSITLICYNRIR